MEDNIMRKLAEKSTVVTFRLGDSDIKRIETAAVLSGRGNRSDVIRRLITLIDTPQGRAVLGIVNDPASEWQRED
jgi:hypothetical protein